MRKITRRKFAQQLGIGAALLKPGLAAMTAVATGDASPLARDPLRPQFHLLPAANWMNDPNGPIYFEGRYHMFYQYNPFGAFWGSMHWGHATSADMVNWRHEPVALAPTPDGPDSDGVFSGCAVLDHGTPTMIYTGVARPSSPAEITLNDGTHTWRETQCIAVSHDGLRSWQKESAPVIASPPSGLAVTGFRDPCVWREGNEWKMVLGSGFAGSGGAILLYRSTDLRHWTYLHPLIEGQPAHEKAMNAVDTGKMWECPDFFPLGDRHVLLISTKRKVFWKTGILREERFVPEREGTLDLGSFYAARTMLDRDGNRILWGWIPETRPESEYRAAGWAGIMSLPRVLTLGDDKTLRMNVAPAVEMLRGEKTEVTFSEDPASANAASTSMASVKTAAAAKSLAAIRIRDLAAELKITFTPDEMRPFQLELRSERDELFASVICRKQDATWEISLNKISAIVTLAADKPVNLRLLLDASVIELFVNDVASITGRVYSAGQTPLKIVFPTGAQAARIEIWPMKPISKDRLTT